MRTQAVPFPSEAERSASELEFLRDQVETFRKEIALLRSENVEVDALRRWLDQHCAPTVGADGEILSLVGRVKRLIDA